MVLTLACAGRAGDTVAPGAGTGDVEYKVYRKAEVPWSVHVVRVPRHNSDFQVHAVHAGGHAIGLSRLSEQATLLDSVTGSTVAAINGDFYQRGGYYAGDPRGVQIVEGELISAPSGASFWIDAVGEPHVGEAQSQFQITWPNGTSAPFGLNGERRGNRPELYTPALGRATHTAGGFDLILEQQTNNAWLPLRPGRTYQARVREVRSGGNAPIAPDTMVLSVGGSPRGRPPAQPGDALVISTATSPSLRGVRTAIGGGPILLRDGKRWRPSAPDSDAYEFSSMSERHPRAAIGWNDDYFFLVEVDGRQRRISIGMTLNELTGFLNGLGCRDAVNLDGGGSATLWYRGQVQNRPCDGYERQIGNALVVVKKRGAANDSKIGGAPAGQSP